MVGTDFTFGKMLITESDVKAFPTLIIQIKASTVDTSFNPRTVPNMAGDLDPLNPFDALLAIPATHYMEYNPVSNSFFSISNQPVHRHHDLGVVVQHFVKFRCL